jgi:hypothetical protein
MIVAMAASVVLVVTTILILYETLSSSLAILPVGVGVISLGWRSRFDP